MPLQKDRLFFLFSKKILCLQKLRVFLNIYFEIVNVLFWPSHRQPIFKPLKCLKLVGKSSPTPPPPSYYYILFFLILEKIIFLIRWVTLIVKLDCASCFPHKIEV